MADGYDVIVLGLGGMGSAAAAHLAARGQRVLGLEQFTPAHDRGSSHGDTRIIRQAYFEGSGYVPLLLRVYELWDELAAEEPDVRTITGGLMIGPAGCETVEGSRVAAEAWDLPHEMLDAEQIRTRFPLYEPAQSDVALYEAKAGFVRPELTVRTHLRRAQAGGADLRFEEPVRSWQVVADGSVAVTTARGTYQGDRLAICPGAWAPTVLADLGLPLTVTRQPLYWLAPTVGTQPFLDMPVFIWEDDQGSQVYGFPAVDGPDGGVKVSVFRGGAPADPDHLDRVVTPAEVEQVRSLLAGRIPALAGPHLRSVACMYTNTPDHDFVIGTHPAHDQVAVAAGFSGHGFKFVPVVGEILADLLLDGRTPHPIDLFRPGRFTAGDRPPMTPPGPAAG